MKDTIQRSRDLAAFRNAQRQYRLAAKRHNEAANELMLAGEFGWAGECLRFADRLGVAALSEKPA